MGFILRLARSNMRRVTTAIALLLAVANLATVCASFQTTTNACKKKKPTIIQLNQMKKTIDKAIRDGGLFHLAAVRLTFHDCISKKCDGCVDLTDENAAGLEHIIGILDKVHKEPQINEFLSKADLYALAGIVGIEIGVRFSNRRDCVDDFRTGCMPEANIPFEWGRKDCADAKKFNEPFPNPNLNKKEMFAYFKDVFGFTKKETTALMGAHSLGRARFHKSGFNGPWTPGRESRPDINHVYHFNNEFYKILSDPKVAFENRAIQPWNEEDKKFLFVTTKKGFRREGIMLNTDMHLMYDIDVDPVEGTNCRVNDQGPKGPNYPKCGLSETAIHVENYAKNATLFMRDFRKVYGKMLRHGYRRLTEIK